MFKKADILTSRYQLKQRLGNTAKGHQTWLAVDLESSEEVTVKLLAFSPEMEWNELKLFEREALKVLESDRLTKNKNLSYSLPAKFLKPECTHIRLIKNATFFKISVPIKSFHRKTLKLICQEMVD